MPAKSYANYLIPVSSLTFFSIRRLMLTFFLMHVCLTFVYFLAPSHTTTSVCETGLSGAIIGNSDSIILPVSQS